MKLSSKSRYGFRAALYLAADYGKGTTQIRTIAEKENISKKYLEKLMAMLKSAGLVKSTRGRKGGYLLSQKPSEIKLSMIFVALEGPLNIVACKKHDRFSKGCNSCVMGKIWASTVMDNCALRILHPL